MQKVLYCQYKLNVNVYCGFVLTNIKEAYKYLRDLSCGYVDQDLSKKLN